MFDRFPDDAKLVMERARLAALELGHEYIATEHMLLGLLAVPECAACALMGDLALDPDQLRDDVKAAVREGWPVEDTGELPFTPASKRALESAAAAADDLGDEHVGTAHLLLGLTEGTAIAAKVLTARGASVERVREAIVRRSGGADPA